MEGSDLAGVSFALLITTLAGLSTGIGSVIALFAKTSKKAFLATALGFSAGVMVYVSLVELLPEARRQLLEGDAAQGSWIALAGFFGGMVLIALIDRLVPSYENPHETPRVEDIATGREPHLERVGLLTALAIGIHNFPEGMAAFFTALETPSLSAPIGLAIALHNIPEGLAVAVPILYATKSKKKAFWYSFLSGLAEPAGALVGYYAIRAILTPALYGVVTAGVAGIMVFISLDQLIPNAKRYEREHASVYGLMAGMAVMAVSLELF